MVYMNEHSANLIAAIADLKRRKAEIETAISSMETILSSVYGEVAASAGTSRRMGQRPNAVPTWTGEARSDKVRRAFAEQPGRIWSAELLADTIGEDTNEATLKAVHAILSRMTRADAIERVGRGAYRSKNASAPAVTGAEDQGESISDSSQEKGGSRDEVSTSLEDHDGSVRSAPDHQDLPGSRASVVIGG